MVAATLGRVLVLAALTCRIIAVVDLVVNEDDEIEGEDAYDPEQLEVGGNEALDGEMPVGRTLFLLHLLKQKLHHKFHGLERVTTTPFPFTGCICVPFYLCDANNTIINDGSGVIDLRYRRCTGDLEVCCFLRATLPTTPPPIPTMPPTMRPPPIPSTIPTTPPPTMPPPPPPTMPPTPSTIPTTRPPSPPPTMPPPPPTMPPTPSTIPTTRPPSPPPTMPPTPSTIPTTRPPSPPPTMPPIPSTLPTTQPPMTIPTTRPPMTIPTSLPITYPVCVCVPVYQCAVCCGAGVPGIPGTIVPGSVPGTIPGGTGAIDGTGVINPRQQQFLNTCLAGMVLCCNYAPGVIPLPAPTTPPATFPPFTLPPTPAPTPPPTPAPTSPPVAQLVLPPIVYGQSCICMLLSACNLGYVTVSGAGSIDPRLILGRQGQPPGTCGAVNSMCCKLQTQDSTAVATQVNTIPSVTAAGEIKNPGTPNACTCVPTGQCAEGNAVTYDNIGAIDPRFGPCASATLVCCRLQNRERADLVVGTPSMQSPVFTSVSPARQLQQTQAICGLRDTTFISQQSAETAYFAEFPWMALLLIRKPGSSDVFQCGGSLINSRAVLTAAHCVVSCDPGTLFVRLGEWNTQVATEPLPFQEVAAQSIIVHPQFFSGGLYHDVAVVVLTRPLTYVANVRPVCLPSQGQLYAAGTICYASGWGRSAFGAGGEYQTVLRKVDLPIVDNANCQARLRTTRLGQYFQLHPSFICAGGQARKDTCYKDGGGPLVCQDQTGRFTQAGIISWGIGCGDSTPAVYASVAQHRQWIDQQLLAYGINN